MAMSGIKDWKWPNPPDMMWYDISEEILEKIHPPQKINSRGGFSVCEINKYRQFVV